jgi:hypothetical protein
MIKSPLYLLDRRLDGPQKKWKPTLDISIEKNMLCTLSFPLHYFNNTLLFTLNIL